MDQFTEKKYFKHLSENQMQTLAHALAKSTIQNISTSSCLNVWLIGELGTGKTTFTRYFLRALGFDGKVKSPTYGLCESYELEIEKVLPAPLSFHHFDLFRINHPTEWVEAGFKDILTHPGISFIEWPEKAEGTLPTPDMEVKLTHLSDDLRDLEICAHSSLGSVILSNTQLSL
ncbi:MAG: tRNA (adenosine(37)-N6)-threonylcarbamoyltransferase complex ATPase subunit type 1 TsaE [Betaproteobacteria bacterium]|jgi:tRNA threonylcarbamoyladenosine biosynthesis protein TsaE